MAGETTTPAPAAAAAAPAAAATIAPEAEATVPSAATNIAASEPAAAGTTGGGATAEPASLITGDEWANRGLPTADDADSAVGDDEDWASSTASIASSILNYRTVHGRTYHSQRETEGTSYWGSNDEMASDWLDLQHHTYTLSIGGKLHLSPLQGDKLSKVLDLGTGTGIWAIDFADEYPNAEVVGTDLSPIQPAWVPANCKFEIDDFNHNWTFKPESADFIHLRWLVGSIASWDRFMEQAFQTLRPGGWVETYDIDAHVASDDGSVTDKSALGQWYAIFAGGAKASGLGNTFTPIRDGSQENSLRNAGFVNIKKVPLKVPIGPWPADKHLKEIGTYQRAVVLMDIEGYAGLMTDALGWTREQLAVWGAHLRTEVKKKSIHGYFNCQVVYGQKPE